VGVLEKGEEVLRTVRALGEAVLALERTRDDMRGLQVTMMMMMMMMMTLTMMLTVMWATMASSAG
jgi:hypothetical protein